MLLTTEVWDLQHAGLQAAGRVSAASDPLSLLIQISQLSVAWCQA